MNPETETPRPEREIKIVELAREQCEVDGEVEFDDDAKLSENDGGDNGCYVQAWAWVDFSGTEFDKEAPGMEK